MFTANGIHLFLHAPEKWDNPGGKDMRAIMCLVLAAVMWLNLQQFLFPSESYIFLPWYRQM